MTPATTATAISYTWASLGFVWLIGLAFTKRTVRRQPAGARLFHIAIALTGFALLGSSWFAGSWLAEPFLHKSGALEVAGLIVTTIGCAHAIWARVTLGGNWSGMATVKAGHELVITGPYAFSRHPIYTGLVTAALGTALAIGELRCILGIILIVLAFTIKMSQEEKLMMQTFPEAYPRYRQRVKALIPGLL